MPWTTPETFTAGQTLTAASMNAISGNLTELAGPFSTWTSWTPTVAQGATSDVSKTVTYARYVKIGRLVVANCRLDMTGAGTAGSGFTISVPSVITSAQNGLRVGGAHVFDSSTNTRYTGQAEFVSTTTLAVVGDWAGNGAWGSVPNLALASGDQIGFSVMYETAT